MASFWFSGSLAGSLSGFLPVLARSSRGPLALAAAVLVASGLQACGPVYGAKAAASPPCGSLAQHGDAG